MEQLRALLRDSRIAHYTQKSQGDRVLTSEDYTVQKP